MSPLKYCRIGKQGEMESDEPLPGNWQERREGPVYTGQDCLCHVPALLLLVVPREYKIFLYYWRRFYTLTKKGKGG